MEEESLYERMTEEGTKRALRITALTVNSLVFAWFVSSHLQGLAHWIVFLVAGFWTWFIVNLFIPCVDYDNSRKRAQRLALLFFISLVLLISPLTRNGVFAFDATMLLTFYYDNHFYGELLAKDMLKIGVGFVAIEFLWVVFSTLNLLQIL